MAFYLKTLLPNRAFLPKALTKGQMLEDNPFRLDKE